jgi:S1-C subfamily serine protease
MYDGALSQFAQLSDELAAITSRVSPILAAIRIAPNRHVTGFLWRDNIVVTADQALPAQDAYSIVLSNGSVAPARPGPRHPGLNLAILLLDYLACEIPLRPAAPAHPGSLVLSMGACFDGSPNVRLAMVQRLDRSAGADPVPVLSLPAAEVDHGALVVNAGGELLGMLRIGSLGEAAVVPHALIARLCDGAAPEPVMPLAVPAATLPLAPAAPAVPHAPPAAAIPAAPRRVTGRVPLGPRKAWLGVALQPITIPEPLAQRAGQNSARMVVSVTQDGPAERAGLRAGDVLLALNGHTTSGSHALRAFLVPDRIGTAVEVRLMRDGTVLATHLTIEAQPAD